MVSLDRERQLRLTTPDRQAKKEENEMILTGPEIERRHEMGDISIDPFVPEHVGPNSVDLRLSNKLLFYDVDRVRIGAVLGDGSEFNLIPYKGTWDCLDMRRDNPTIPIDIPEDG